MRYAKGSFVITPERDIPLLRLVRNCRFVGHQQLFELLQYDGMASCRRTFNWRVQRLLHTGHIARLHTVSWQGSPVYSVNRNILRKLDSDVEFSLALNSRYHKITDDTKMCYSIIF